jgi:hypothetical protein
MLLRMLHVHEIARVTRNERGVALPMALFTLLLMTSLSLAFLTLGQTEPVVSNNHMRSAQARVLAEAGVERAVWAMTFGGLAAPAASAVAASPYDGNSFLTTPGNVGGFTVRVTGVSSFEVLVDTVGWTPTNDTTDTRSKAHRRVQTPLIKLPDFGQTPCALCVRGDLEVRGSASISATADTSCGNKYGTTSSGQLCLGSSCDPSDSNWGNNGSINGATGTNVGTDNEPNDYQMNVSTSTFDPFTLNAAQLAALKQLATDYGTFYSGDVTFNSSNRVPAKPIVFVEGNLFTSGNPYTGGAFNGWIIVMGSISLGGNGTINGMLYATNDVSSSSGTNTINGLVVSQNESNSSFIDTTTTGNMTITYDCAKARGSGNFPQGWFPKPGGWREPAG